MINPLEFLTEDTSQAQISAASDQLTSELDQKKLDLGKQDSERELLLGSGDTSGLRKHDQRGVEISYEIESLEFSLKKLEKAAEDRSAQDELEKLDLWYTTAEAHSERSKKLFPKYNEHAQEIAKILKEIMAIDKVVLRANNALKDRGDARRVQKTHQRAGNDGRSLQSLPETVALPPAAVGNVSIWGDRPRHMSYEIEIEAEVQRRVDKMLAGLEPQST